MNNILEGILTIIGLIILTTLIIFGIAFSAKNEWNNGICTECGNGHYVYETVVGHRHSTGYIYSCDNCGHHIETPIEMN